MDTPQSSLSDQVGKMMGRNGIMIIVKKVKTNFSCIQIFKVKETRKKDEAARAPKELIEIMKLGEAAFGRVGDSGAGVGFIGVVVGGPAGGGGSSTAGAGVGARLGAGGRVLSAITTTTSFSFLRQLSLIPLMK